MLAIVRRPFEAHLLKYRYKGTTNLLATPSLSHRPSPSRSVSLSSVNSRDHASASIHRSTLSAHSIADVETTDLDSASPPSIIHAPSPVHPIGLGILRSSDRLPQIPTAFLQLKRTHSLETLPQMFYPTKYSTHLPLPPRMSTLIAPSRIAPHNNPVQYSASAWKAVHPTLPMPTMPSPLGHATSTSRPVSSASRSNIHLPYNGSTHSFNFYRSGYSRSSVSLTRPNRLSTVSPPQPAGSVSWSDSSVSTGPDEGRRSGSLDKRDGSPIAGATDRMSESEEEMVQAYRILASAAQPRGPKAGHVRHASAPDSTGGASHSYTYSGRKAKGWKPRLKGQGQAVGGTPLKSQIVRSSSAELLGKASLDSSVSGGASESLSEVFEDALRVRWSVVIDVKQQTPVRKTRSESPLRPSDIPEDLEAGTVRERTTTVSRTPQTPMMKRRMLFEEVKNKPLPMITAL
jgi:hypothetical protein